MEKVFITRAFNISAGHRLFIEELSVEENIKMFDKCANPKGHGHDYRVEMMFADQISDKTGMVISRQDMDNAVADIVNEMDHKRIDQEIPFFRKNQSTVENITLYIWNKIYEKYGKRLAYVKVWENDRSYFEYHEEEIR